jgi:hypothetical protein
LQTGFIGRIGTTLAEVAHDGVDLSRIETGGRQQVARMRLKRVNAL